jgi:hypothetical protein
MTKIKVIHELLRRIKDVLEAKLTDAKYSEYLRGSISFRLDLVQVPTKHFVTLNLPSRKIEPKPLKIQFKRKYTRRQGIELPPEKVEGLNAEQG